MKVLFYYFHGTGGAVENFYHLLDAFSNLNEDIKLTIVCDSNSKLNELSQKFNVEVIHTEIIFSREITRLYYNLIFLRKIIKKINPDVIWSLNIGPYFYSKKLQILSVNNAFQIYPFDFYKFHPSNKLNFFLLRVFFRISLFFSNTVFTQTSLMSLYIKNIINKPVSVYSKAVDKSKFLKSNNIMCKSDTLNFLYISTFSPHKNHIVLMKVFSKLRLMYIENPKIFKNKKPVLTLSISFDNAKSLTKDVETLVHEGFIKCLGWINNDQISILYEQTDICLMPSFLECLSSSHLEAFAYSKPQIVADVPYAHDLCKNAALYANPSRADEWIENILNLINNPNLCAELVQEGNEIFSKFPTSWDEIAQSIFNEFLIYLKRV